MRRGFRWRPQVVAADTGTSRAKVPSGGGPQSPSAGGARSGRALITSLRVVITPTQGLIAANKVNNLGPQSPTSRPPATIWSISSLNTLSGATPWFYGAARASTTGG